MTIEVQVQKCIVPIEADISNVLCFRLTFTLKSSNERIKKILAMAVESLERAGFPVFRKLFLGSLPWEAYVGAARLQTHTDSIISSQLRLLIKFS